MLGTQQGIKFILFCCCLFDLKKKEKASQIPGVTKSFKLCRGNAKVLSLYVCECGFTNKGTHTHTQ